MRNAGVRKGRDAAREHACMKGGRMPRADAPAPRAGNAGPSRNFRLDSRCGPDTNKSMSILYRRTGSLRRAAGVLLLFLTAFASGSAPAATAGAGGDEREENVARAVLDNGLEVVVVRNTLSPAATTVIGYRAGANESPKGFPGTAHALEHMMFRGSPGLSAGQLANISAAMGGMFNAVTRQNATQYFFTVPAADLETALTIESLRMRGVIGGEDTWSRERGAMLQEVARNLSIPEYVFYTRLREALFRGTPYEQDALGTRPSLEETTGAMLRGFHRTWYTPGNAVLVVAGDVDLQGTLDTVRRLFGTIPSREVPDRPTVSLQPVKPQTIRLDTDRPYGSVVLSWRMPGYEDPDHAASLVLSEALNNRRGRLYSLVTGGRALDAGFRIETFAEAGLGYAVALFPPGADPGRLEGELRQVLSDVVSSGLTEDLVSAARRRIMTDAELEKNSVPGLAMAWSTALVVEGRESPDEILKAVSRVSAADVSRVARAYIDPGRCVTGILTPEPSGEAVASGGFGGVESFVPENVEPVELPPWAQKTMGRLSVPRSSVSPQVSTLSNGLRLIVQPEDVSDTVCIYGHVLNRPELQVPVGREGVEGVLESLFPYGTTSLDREAFHRELDKIGAFVSAGTDFTLEVMREHAEKGVELLADNLLRPALPEEAFEIVRGQEAAAAAGRLKSPEYRAEMAVRRALYPEGDPMLREATSGTVSSLEIGEVRSYWRKVFRPDMTTIVVMGRITPGEARSLVEKHFGSWEVPREPRPDVVLAPVPGNKPSSVGVPNPSRVQSRVVLTQNLGISRSHPDYYALQLGNHVLGGAFYATRLYRDLREQAGLVYHVSSYFDMDQSRGRYTVEYACDPSRVATARALVERNLRGMRTREVSGGELMRAKALLLRRIPLAESSVSGIARGFLHRVRLDLPLDEPTRAAQRYLGLTAGEVKDAFARWVSAEELVQVVEGLGSD